jgi:hypothetical protein
MHMVWLENLLDIEAQQASQDILSRWDVLLRHARRLIACERAGRAAGTSEV